MASYETGCRGLSIHVGHSETEFSCGVKTHSKSIVWVVVKTERKWDIPFNVDSPGGSSVITINPGSDVVFVADGNATNCLKSVKNIMESHTQSHELEKVI